VRVQVPQEAGCEAQIRELAHSHAGQWKTCKAPARTRSAFLVKSLFKTCYFLSKIALDFQVCINKLDVGTLNQKALTKQRAVSFDDMLIMHLVQGRDHFVTVHGEYIKLA
jgi:hypothetical protein